MNRSTSDPTCTIEARLQVVVVENETERELPIGLSTDEAAGLVIGRGRNADVSIQDAYLSGRHVSITSRSQRHHVEDLGSTHGTTVNGKAITSGHPHRLEDGDQVVFGKCVATYIRVERSITVASSLPTAPVPETEGGEVVSRDDKSSEAGSQSKTIEPASSVKKLTSHDTTHETSTEEDESVSAGSEKLWYVFAVGLIILVLAVAGVMAWQVFFSAG